jgi:hypothetical protein
MAAAAPPTSAELTLDLRRRQCELMVYVAMGVYALGVLLFFIELQTWPTLFYYTASRIALFVVVWVGAGFAIAQLLSARAMPVHRAGRVLSRTVLCGFGALAIGMFAIAAGRIAGLLLWWATGFSFWVLLGLGAWLAFLSLLVLLQSRWCRGASLLWRGFALIGGLLVILHVALNVVILLYWDPPARMPEFLKLRSHHAVDWLMIGLLGTTLLTFHLSCRRLAEVRNQILATNVEPGPPQYNLRVLWLTITVLCLSFAAFKTFLRTSGEAVREYHAQPIICGVRTAL